MRKILSFLFCLGVGFPTAYAGQINVVNENRKALTIKIHAEGNEVSENLPTYVKNIPADYNSTFIVETNTLNGKSHYSIKGDTNPFTMGDKCKHLSVDKNYKVTFLNDTVGTTCVAEEIK